MDLFVRRPGLRDGAFHSHVLRRRRIFVLWGAGHGTLLSNGQIETQTDFRQKIAAQYFEINR